MEILLIVIIFLVTFVYSLKQTYSDRRQLLLWAFVCFLVTYLYGSIAITISKTDFASWFADKSLMKDIAVLVFLEVILNISFCIVTVINKNAIQKSRLFLMGNKVLNFFPGLCIFPTLCYIQSKTIYLFPGIDFGIIRIVTSAIIFVSLPLASWLIKLILPEEEIRTELLFISSVVLAIAATLLSMN